MMGAFHLYFLRYLITKALIPWPFTILNLGSLLNHVETDFRYVKQDSTMKQ